MTFSVTAQFAPPAGQPGSTAISKDSSVFVAWAASCTVTRGYMDISAPDSGFASAGLDEFGTGKAMENATVSLGDGGAAVVTFDGYIYDGPGWDFAVFENGFDDLFLELAFVEVSSDGVSYFRFPAASLTPFDTQTGTFGYTDATKINNLAGKYRLGYGTPFDLSELAAMPGLDISHITHVRIVDVVGAVNTAYSSSDHQGNIVNDPWPTPWPTGGFDLDAVGVIHKKNWISTDNPVTQSFSVYPNPVDNTLYIQSGSNNAGEINIRDITGKICYSGRLSPGGSEISVSGLVNGLYMIYFFDENKNRIGCQKMSVIHR